MIENKTGDVNARFFSVIDDNTFGKIRSGLIEEKNTQKETKEENFVLNTLRNGDNKNSTV